MARAKSGTRRGSWAKRWRERGGRLRPAAFQVGAAAALAAAILPVREGSGRDPVEPGLGSTLDYVETVNRIFVGMNWLQYNEPALGVQRRVVELSPEAVRYPQVLDFYARSPLASDIAANDELRWRLRGSNVEGLDPGARRADGPFARTDWFGAILFGSGMPAATLTGDDGRQIVLLPATEPGRMTVVPIGQAAGRTVVDGPVRFTDEGNDTVAEMRLIGRTPVLFAHQGASTRVLVDTPHGRKESTYDAATGRNALELSEGGAIDFYRDGRHLRRLRLGSLSAALSYHRPFAGRFVDESLGSFGRSIDAAFRASRLESAQDVRLTIDRDLNGAVQSELNAFLASEFADRDPGSVRAAVLVMDTLSGEVLALAGGRAATDGTDGAAAPAGEMRNENFAALPVGSVAKVPVSAAILAQHPGLRSLRVVSTGPFSEVLGIDMEGEQLEEASARDIDFATYLTQSSNRFATTLMLLALAPDPWLASRCPSEEYWLGDRRGVGAERRTFAPVFAIPRAPLDCGERFALPLGAPLSSYLGDRSPDADWVGLLDLLFDLPGTEHPPIRYDTGPWRLASGEETPPRAFEAVSPQRESFGLGAIRQFHNDYVNLILGGVNSRWTTFKVAEAYSRVVAGTRVAATLVRHDAIRPAPALSPLPPPVREALLGGLAGVVRHPSGTAFPYLSRPSPGDRAPLASLEQIAAALPAEEIRMFAKTGTPTLSRSREVPEWQAIGNLAARRIILADPDPRRLLAVAGAGAGEPDAAALARHPAALDEVRARGLTIADLARGLAAMRRELQRQPRPIQTASGALSLPTTRLLPETAGRPRINGGVIAVVVGRYCRAAPALAPPARALTIVINIQAREAGNPAGELARRLMQPHSPLVRRLFDRATNCEARQL